MAQDFFFRELKNYADKEYKFRQRKSLNQIPVAQRNAGVCASVCMLWIAEKFAHNKIDFLRKGEAFSDGDQEDQHNEVIMLRAHQLQQRCYAGQGGDLTNLEQELKLQKVPSRVISDNAAATPNKPISERMATVMGTLQNGQAVAFELRVPRGQNAFDGHMVAAYKSRDGSIHFFEPNAGVYSIDSSQVTEFMRGLERAWGNRGWEDVGPRFRPHLQDHNWAQLYRR